MYEKITKTGENLHVPNRIIIPYVEGDGVGAEITPAALKVVDRAVSRAYGKGRSIEWKEVFAGSKALEKTGSLLPCETVEAFREYLVGVKGPLTTPVGEGSRSLNVTLRQTLDLYVCLRPVRSFRGIVSPLREPQKVNMTVFRENTEDIYAGIEWMQGTPEALKFMNFLSCEMGVSKVRFPQTSSFGVKPVSVEGSERLVAAAVEYAIKHKLPSVTLVHKGNIMKYTEGGFKRWGYDVAERRYGDRVFTMRQYSEIKNRNGENEASKALEEARHAGKVIIKDVIADAFLQNTLLVPEEYSVIATLNLNGDYISDQLAAMVGGIGIAPGANINCLSGHAIFEATHGTAPDIAGRDMANPSSLLLSLAMMLEYIGWDDAANLIVSSVEKTFAQGFVTCDLARFNSRTETLGTSRFAETVINNL
ncbi:MAG: NADP-dependent isocitrate dehydrogenase [Prevotellaceae bacterium]|jgi:isocitrate dehydrogenase|nr:NADP-dependent isocitrate dehydrogenase [Prevotellaceae bacterium]